MTYQSRNRIYPNNIDPKLVHIMKKSTQPCTLYQKHLPYCDKTNPPTCSKKTFTLQWIYFVTPKSHKNATLPWFYLKTRKINTTVPKSSTLPWFYFQAKKTHLPYLTITSWSIRLSLWCNTLNTSEPDQR